MKIKAHAKINLSLDVLGVRADGYHEIVSVMQPLKLHDSLEVQWLERDIQVESFHPEVPSGPENSVYHAAEQMRQAYFCHRGAKIFIHKEIPVAAGLAGGSANAAAALRALNSLWEINVEEEELFRLAEKVGSDVPFCLLGKTALAAGRGEILTPLPPFSGFGVVLVKPPFGVSTAEVYRLYDDLQAVSAPSTGEVVKAVEKRDLRLLTGMLSNALERVTTRLHPEIIEIKKALVGAGAQGALMSGSGPTVFGLCSCPEEAQSVASRLNLPGCRIIATETI